MIDGTKTFELRRDDRGFQVDDRLILCEWDPETEAYTGRRARFSVTYVTDGAAFGALADGFVCLGLRPIDRKTALTAARAEKALIEFRKTTEDAELYPGLTRAAFDAGRRFEQGLGARSRPDDLRARGWAVAVHNDYRQDAVPHTFWLFTKGELAAKGKGRTDAEALDAARRDIDRLEAK